MLGLNRLLFPKLLFYLFADYSLPWYLLRKYKIINNQMW